MKKFSVRTLCHFILLFFSTTLFAQSGGFLKFQLQVYKKDGMAYRGCPVTLIETTTFERKTFKTNGGGTLLLELNEGSEWVMNIGEMRNYEILRVPPNGISTGGATATYDVERWKRINRKPTDRSGMQFEEIIQRLPENAMPGKDHELLEVKVQTDAGKPYRGLQVDMTSFALGQKFTAETDHQGIARFKLPLNNEYQIDLDGEEDFEYHDVGNIPYKKRITLTYETMRFKEEVNEEGYIEQTFLENPRPISNRVFVGVTVIGGPNNGIKEDVYLEMAHTNKKYHGVTDQNGKVFFMLPKKREYKVDFNFQKGAGSINLKRFYGIGQMNQTFLYTPEERLQYPERFLPSANDVKTYDMNNFREDGYPNTPDDELLNVHVNWGSNKISETSREALLEIGFSVKEPPNKKAIEKPLNIAFVLDKSGSMSGDRIDLLKEAMFAFVEKLRPIDRVSLVFFSDTAVAAYPSQAVNKTVLKDMISACQAGGGTSIYDGLVVGYKEVEKNKSANSVNRLILLTDGFGSKPVEDVVNLSKEHFKNGISVSTIGVGESYNSAMLSLLSKYSGGLEHQTINSEGISEALDKEFESLLYPLASNLKVVVKYNDMILYKSLYGVPEDKNENGQVQFKLDKIFSSLNRMVLMKFKLNNPNPKIEEEEISIDITYYDELKKEDVHILKKAKLEWSEESDVEFIHDRELARTYSVAVINQMLKTIAELCDSKDYVNARLQIMETIESVKKMNKNKFHPDMLPIIEQLNTYLEGLEQAIRNGN